MAFFAGGWQTSAVLSNLSCYERSAIQEDVHNDYYLSISHDEWPSDRMNKPPREDEWRQRKKIFDGTSLEWLSAALQDMTERER